MKATESAARLTVGAEPAWLGCLLLILIGWGVEARAGASLFDMDPETGLEVDARPLHLTLSAPFHRISNDRVGEPDYRDGTLQFSFGDDEPVSMPVEIRTRGKTRRKKTTCNFPPLRLRIAEEESAGTPFGGQKTFKLVTHCRPGDHSEQLVLKEYLAYRVFNLITDFSFRVRLARVSYRQPNGSELIERYGVLLEHWKAVADRTGVQPVEADGGIDQAALNPAAANRFAVFQYLIGNEDFSMVWPEQREDCCHNAKPLFEAGQVIPVPYDFDFAGIVDAPYAVPRPPNRDVRNRRYGGLCSTVADLEPILEEFRLRQEAIESVYRTQVGLADHERQVALAYLAEFFEVIGDPQKVESELVSRCQDD